MRADEGKTVWTRDEIIFALRREAERGRHMSAETWKWGKQRTAHRKAVAYLEGESHKLPPNSEVWRDDGIPNLATIQRHFGSWNAALTAAGLPTRAQHEKRWTRGKVIRALQRETKRRGRPPSEGEWDRPTTKSRPSANTVKRIFGSWNAALEAAGLPLNVVPSGEQHYNAKLTVEAVRAIRSSTESLSVAAKRFGVSRSTVSLIRRRETWASV